MNAGCEDLFHVDDNYASEELPIRFVSNEKNICLSGNYDTSNIDLMYPVNLNPEIYYSVKVLNSGYKNPIYANNDFQYIGNSNYDFSNYKSVYVPPHIILHLYGKRDYFDSEIEKRVITYHTDESIGIPEYGISEKKVRLTGGKWYYNVHWPFSDVKDLTDVYAFRIELLRPWDHHLTLCCMGNSYGNKNINSDDMVCGSFWKNTNTNGICDSIMTNHCDCDNIMNMTDDDRKLCSCICYGKRIQIQYPGTEDAVAEMTAICSDPNCTTYGYATQNMKDITTTGCPDVVNCKQEVILGEGSSDILINNLKMQQICGIMYPAGDTKGDNTLSNDAPVLDKNDIQESKLDFGNVMLWTIIILIGILIAVLLFMSRSNKVVIDSEEYTLDEFDTYYN